MSKYARTKTEAQRGRVCRFKAASERIAMPVFDRKLVTPPLAFDHDDAARAAESWNCSCGPAALAAAIGADLDTVRGLVGEDFPTKGYMSPTMMRVAIERAGWRIESDDRVHHGTWRTFPTGALVRIQWEGPWTAPGSNPRWAYGATHWISTLLHEGYVWIFDINQGWAPAWYWQEKTLPMIVANVRRATGGWYATHSWLIAKEARA